MLGPEDGLLHEVKWAQGTLKVHSSALPHCSLRLEVMTNLDNILKSRDITLPTKVCLVKAMVFPVVMYGCESCTVRKAEGRKIDVLNYGVGEDS